MILRARVILPICAPPIEDGGIILNGGRISRVAPFRDLRPSTREKVFDLGEVALLPGLINAHCHLDYTDMAGQLPPPRTFTDWIASITAAKTGWSYSDYARSWLNGARQLLSTGVTTVADIEAMPDLLPEVWLATPLRVFSFCEMTGILSRREPREILGEAVEKIGTLKHPRNRAMLSPHAAYSTLPELLQRIATAAHRRKWRVCTHIAESEQEFEMFQFARGKMYEWLGRNGRDNSDCGQGSPVAHFARNKLLGENVLAIHVNYLARGDATLLAKNQTHVVHCPRSHDYFKHTPFPRQRLANAGVNLCLGTDSLATTRQSGKEKPQLNLFAEMRLMADRDPSISPAEILQIATFHGARALGLGGQIGQLSKNAAADLITIPFGGKIGSLLEAVIQYSGRIQAGMIAGNWTIPPP
jgi:cytosine/adenosine deaminase-related metal-dependent hydrolase